MSEVIDRFSGTHAFLSNFHRTRLHVSAGGTAWDGEWPSAEHLYQSMKTLDPDEVERIRSVPLARDAKRAGMSVKLRPGWDEIKIPCMVQVLILKFGIGSELAGRLLATGEREIVEGNTWGDTFWGVCDGVGENHLGRLLMQRRELLREVADARTA